jgi:hypothetical protein
MKSSFIKKWVRRLAALQPVIELMEASLCRTETSRVP